MSARDELRERARQADILETARRFSVLRRITTTEYVGPCPRCGGVDRFGVNTRKQVWNCRGCRKGGDVIALVRHALDLTFEQAIAELTGETMSETTPRAPAKALAAADHLGLAGQIWDDTLPLGEDAKAYFARRAIDIDAVPDHSGLRWHPRCPWGSGTAPCIVGRFTDAVTNEARGIWRRRIDLSVEKPRTLGPMAGCVIRLWPDEEVTMGLVVGEGVETVLAAATRIEHLGTLLQPAWACGGTANLAAFPVLGGIEAVTIVVDRDEAGGGQRAAETCARRWLDAGREVIRLTPRLAGDFNDIVGRRA